MKLYAISLLGIMILGNGCKTKNSVTLDEGINMKKVEGTTFNQDFFFGVATAPAHVENNLDDIWLDFAKTKRQDNKWNVKSWHDAPQPEIRLNFWSKPEVEIELAKELGVSVFRLGIDWGRLVPNKPGTKLCGRTKDRLCDGSISNLDAVQRYQEIIQMVKDRGMKVMLTLYHHSMPKWLSNDGGWTNENALKYFQVFSQDAGAFFNKQVDYWVIFNEPAVFATLSHGAGVWPPGGGMNWSNITLAFTTGTGAIIKAMDQMIAAHNVVYSDLKKITNAPVGIAHNIGYHTASDIIARYIRKKTIDIMNYRFIDKTKDHIDFLGLNYYGEERIQATSVGIADDLEYSESGRAVNPNGLYRLLKDFHQRYNIDAETKSSKAPVPIIITENGISDDTDIIRPAYLIEHLMAISEAQKEGVPIFGYVLWTLSDNWEWSDGYCPKFGIIEVNRKTQELKRTRRPSFYLYQEIASSRTITKNLRIRALNTVHRAHKASVDRYMCRLQDGTDTVELAKDAWPRKIRPMNWMFQK